MTSSTRRRSSTPATPEELGAGLPRADARCCRSSGCSAAAAAPTTATSARSAGPAAMSMRPEPPRLRPARPGDADDLARLVDLASEGLARHLWAGMAEPGEDAARRRRAPRRPRRGRLLLAERGDGRDRRRVAGGARRLPDRRRAGAARRAAGDVPAAAGAGEPRARHRTTSTCSRRYPAFRRRGVARGCWRRRRGGARARAGLSLIVADRNARRGGSTRPSASPRPAREPMVKEGWQNREPGTGCSCSSRWDRLGAASSAGERDGGRGQAAAGAARGRRAYRPAAAISRPTGSRDASGRGGAGRGWRAVGARNVARDDSDGAPGARSLARDRGGSPAW